MRFLCIFAQNSNCLVNSSLRKKEKTEGGKQRGKMFLFVQCLQCFLLTHTVRLNDILHRKCMSIIDSEVRRNSCNRVPLSCLFSLVSLDLTSLWLVFGCPKLLIRRGRDCGEREGGEEGCNQLNFVRYLLEMVFCSERTCLHTSPENNSIQELLHSELSFLWDEGVA